MKMVHVYSGGLDSTVLLVDLLNQKHQVQCINFHYGSKHNCKERAAAVRICKKFNVPLELVDIGFVNKLFSSSLLQGGGDIPEGHYAQDNMKSTVVPFRNGIMLSIAAGYAESLEFDIVSYAAHSGDHAIYPDCREEFFSSLSSAVRFGTYRCVLLMAPYLKISKTGIVKHGARLESPTVPFELTWTCYKGNKVHCGKCGACTERKEAFRDSGIKDPTEYEDEKKD